jgi:hypothetical protein
MDLVGNGPDGARLPDGGPTQANSDLFDPTDPKECWSYHAVAAVVRAVSLLASLPEVDPKRIGITGISWGGYLTCIVSGLDDRLKVAVPVYGCGFIYENSAWTETFRALPDKQREMWIANFDPSRYLGRASMPMLFVNGTNDFAYWLDSYQKSYRLVRKRALCVTVNMPHSHQDGWAPVEIGLFVDSHLRGGVPLAWVKSAKRRGSLVEVRFESRMPVKSTALHYTTDTGPWPGRKWETGEAQIDGNIIRVRIPDARPLVYFVTLTDGRGGTVSTEHEVLSE